MEAKRKVIYRKSLMAGQTEYEESNIVAPLKNRIPKSSSGRPRGIRLPQYIVFNILPGKILTLYIQDQESDNGDILNPVCANMQTDNAAFEGWAITLKAWLPEKIERVILKWDIPASELKNNHYHRFLYRCARFKERYEWFDIDSSNRNEVNDFMALQFVDLTINVSLAEPEKKSNDENAVEYEFCDPKGENNAVRNSLMSHYGLDQLNHQLPVGVKSHGRLLFTGGQSAIDLWGIDETSRSVSVLELKYISEEKTSKNLKVGIISELFLYANIMRDLILGTIHNEPAVLTDERMLYEQIHSFRQVNAIMLSNEFHPLVESAAVLELLNSATTDSGVPSIVFKRSHYRYLRGSFDLKNIETF